MTNDFFEKFTYFISMKDVSWWIWVSNLDRCKEVIILLCSFFKSLNEKDVTLWDLILKPRWEFEAVRCKNRKNTVLLRSFHETILGQCWWRDEFCNKTFNVYDLNELQSFSRHLRSLNVFTDCSLIRVVQNKKAEAVRSDVGFGRRNGRNSTLYRQVKTYSSARMSSVRTSYRGRWGASSSVGVRGRARVFTCLYSIFKARNKKFLV